VFICDLNKDALEQAAAMLTTYGEVKSYVLDVSSEAEVTEMFAKVHEEYGKLDIFVNNAGVYPQRFLCEMDLKQWDLTMNVNVKSVFLCAREAFRYMKTTGGVIINAASYAALIGSAGSGAYAASKSAVYSLTKTLAAELAPYGIRVNGFIPGVIETGMTQGVIDAKKEELVQAIALHRLGEPKDVANAVAFLASEEASYLTGTFIEVSGGKICVQNPDSPWKKLQQEGQ
jgi:NAD(P)-dependent dehydrogenase (short-subunit alcohol dehydrogenase family)